MKIYSKAYRLVLLSLLVSLALILSYLESFIPIPIPLPGAKLGLPNIVTMVSLTMLGWPLTLLVVVARIFLSGFMFGNFFSIFYSLSGGLLSLFVMASFLHLFKNNYSIIIVSVFGSIAHNFGQIIVAAIVLENINLFFLYFPFLMLIGIITGIITGIMAKGLLSLFKKSNSFNTHNL